jgi:uncharacterized protein (DUF1800 family)
MLGTQAPLAERLAFFWHGHFATSNAKVQDAGLMWAQYRLFRTKGAGLFPDLVRAVVRDPAMLRWLDGDANRKGHPNENLGRELMELFTLGVGHYDENDVQQVARSLTGHGTEGRAYRYAASFHDDGVKEVLGKRGRFDADDVVDILCASPACHAFLADRLLRHFGTPDEVEVARIAGVLESSGGDVTRALEAILRGPSFRSDRYAKRVRSPVEFLLAGLGAAGITELPSWAVGHLARMGQTLFRPPSVKGWPEDDLWLSASGLAARIDAARRIAEETRDVASFESLAFPEGPTPELRRLRSRSSRQARVALALASPEFQLS